MDVPDCPMKNIGKPDAGKPHVRFDEGGLMNDRANRHAVAASGETSGKSHVARSVSLLSTLPKFCRH